VPEAAALARLRAQALASRLRWRSRLGPRPSSFIRLGKSPTTKWKLVITGAHNVARPNAACDRGDSPCGTRDGGSASGTTTFTSPALPDNDNLVFGKPDLAGCQDISVDVEIGDAG
jgi:hypothetical protein